MNGSPSWQMCLQLETPIRVHPAPTRTSSLFRHCEVRFVGGIPWSITAVFIVELNTPLLELVDQQLALLPLEITRRRNCETRNPGGVSRHQLITQSRPELIFIPQLLLVHDRIQYSSSVIHIHVPPEVRKYRTVFLG